MASKIVRKRRRGSSCSKGNSVLTTLIPGLKRPIDIQFPDGKLPVCQRCKKIYKTRELCRIRDGHTDKPWNTTYLCISFDDTCLTLNSMGETCLVDEERMQRQYIAQLINEPPLPFRANKIHEDGILHSPICTACKEKNYTRHHCRVKQQHMQLPWVTMYVMLSTIPHYDPVDHNGSGINSDTPFSPQSWSKKNNPASYIGGDKSAGKKSIDDIQKVPPSRTCLLTITSFSPTLRWLEIDPCVPRTEYKSISSFTGTPSATMNQWHNRSNPLLSVVNSIYSSREPMPEHRYTINQDYHRNNPYYPHWTQNVEHQSRGPPMHSQGPPGTPSFYDYPPDNYNAYQYQQMEHNMRQSYAIGYGQHQTPPQNPNVFQEMSNRDYYNKYYNYNNVPYSQATGAAPDLNDQHSGNSDQKESMSQSPVTEPTTYWSHSEHSDHSN